MRPHSISKRLSPLGYVGLASLAIVSAETERGRLPRRTQLTPRENDALALVLAGLSTKEIAGRLGVSVNTAATYTKAIFRYFGAPSRVALLVLLKDAEPPCGSPGEAPVSLAPRQRETLDLVIEGLSTKQIAERLRISVHAVNQRMRAIFRRFGVGSRAALVARVLRQRCSESPDRIGGLGDAPAQPCEAPTLRARSAGADREREDRPR
jgi:DNA-binding CsgD family transcriptional regulator